MHVVVSGFDRAHVPLFKYNTLIISQFFIRNASTHQRDTSPYARKVRIVLAEKEIPFELVTEVPWDSTTKTPLHNPLEKLPVLILEDGSSVYESHFILEYIEAKFPTTTPMLPPNTDDKLFAKKIEVVVDGMCDALVLLFEKQRAEGGQSEEWKARQMRKVDGGFKALADWVGKKQFIIGDTFGHADVAVGCLCGYVDVRLGEYPWRKTDHDLAKYADGLNERQSFKDTVPYAQKILDKIV